MTAAVDPTKLYSKRCPRCHSFKVFKVTAWQKRKYMDTQELIQNIFPDMSADDRERLVSGYCPKCWDILFADPRDAQH